MNMGLLAADLSLGSSAMKESSAVVKHHPTNRHPLDVHSTSIPCDLRALEVYHRALEDELLKIQAFERELPFCMQLLENAIEASKEQLEERLACKLNTPLHEPQLASTTHEFVCNYRRSSTHRSLLPGVGEINLHFKRKWTNSGLSTSQDQYPHPLHRPYTGSSCASKWLLPQNPELAQHAEDVPITCIKGSIKIQEFSIPEHDAVAPSTDKESQLLATEVAGCHTKVMHAAKQPVPSSNHLYRQENRYMLRTMQKVDDPDMERISYTGSVPAKALLSAPLSKACSAAAVLPSCSMLAGPPAAGAQPSRKPRRCWSSELHQRFLSALSHLGGCQVATPKQIRELMNVDGLTNDEVKSHLQKFRLHMRRPNSSSQGSLQQAAAPAGHHLVVFGHIWVPPQFEEQNNGHSTNRAANNMDQLMQTSFPSNTSNELITRLEHVQESWSAQPNDPKRVQYTDGSASQAGGQLLRLCQGNTYSKRTDQKPLQDERTDVYAGRHHNVDEGCSIMDQRKNAASVATSKGGTYSCRHQQQLQATGAGGSPESESADGLGSCRTDDHATVLITAKEGEWRAQHGRKPLDADHSANH